jgi:hypothetical protein
MKNLLKKHLHEKIIILPHKRECILISVSDEYFAVKTRIDDETTYYYPYSAITEISIFTPKPDVDYTLSDPFYFVGITINSSDEKSHLF